jgi:excinuclease ABC subunit C
MNGKKTAASFAQGAEIIRTQLRTTPESPGVYRMLSVDGTALYVGKAKNLKKRVTSYTQEARLPLRLRRMVALTKSMELVVTHTEVEALLLEANLVLQLQPRYNILLRDDKSFPYILITRDHEFPAITKHRGARNRKGWYFGPFASGQAVTETLLLLQRGFMLRNCTDAMFKTRTRPCLQYHIKRCTAPCVGKVAPEYYAVQVDDAREFLSGKSSAIQEKLAQQMQTASDALDYETAAKLRDRIKTLTGIQSRQDINVAGVGDADVIAAYKEAGHIAIQLFFFRNDRNFGTRSYFPIHDPEAEIEEVLAAFLAQFYADKPAPPELLLSHMPDEAVLLAEALARQSEHLVDLHVPQRGAKRRLVDHAADNAKAALSRHMAESATQRKLLQGVADLFNLPDPPRRIEVYDNSHIQGTNAVGAMIVANAEGFDKKSYRKFSIKGSLSTKSPNSLSPVLDGGEIRTLRGSVREGEGGSKPGTTDEALPQIHPPLTQPLPRQERGRGALKSFTEPSTAQTLPRYNPGDDYAMMREMLTRRLQRLLDEDPERKTTAWPDLLLIDGGLGQLHSVQSVLDELGLTDIAVVGIAKGVDRDAGREKFFLPGREAFTLPPNDPVLYYLQRLRDEAHRFVIGAHRQKRTNAISATPLDDVPGIGAVRKRALLHHFGSARAVAQAGIDDLRKVTGISAAMAQKIYGHFH